MLWAGFMHDGRAATPRIAVEEHHAGEAAKSSYKFKALSEKKKKLLEEFLDTL